MFVCLWLPTPREVPCCGTSGEFPSLKGLCTCVWVRDTGRGDKDVWDEFQICNIAPLLMLFDLSPLNKADWPKISYTRWPFLKGDLFSTQYRLCQPLLYINPENFTIPTHSITVCSFHCSSLLHPLTHTRTLTDATFTSLPPCPSPVSGQKWKDYRGKGVPLSLEIGQVLCACSCLSLSRGPCTEQ